MGYLYAFLVALLYSTTGLLSKTAGGTIHPVLITLGRFVFGAGCMALLLLAQKRGSGCTFSARRSSGARRAKP